MLMLMPRMPVGQAAAGGGVFGTVFSASLGSNGTGYTGVTFRYVFAFAGLTTPTSAPTQTRVRFKANTATEGLTITAAYIGHKAAAGDSYDFATTPVQLLFSGSGSTTIAIGASTTSDAVSFAWDRATDIVIAFYVNDAAHDCAAFNGSASNVTSFTLAGSDASTVNTSGYSSGGSRLDAIDLIEMNGF